MSDTSDQPEAASDKRRDQARERQRKRSDLNRHYMEEAALSALDAGSLKDLTVDLLFPARNLMGDVTGWLGVDSTAAINQAIHFAASLVADGIATVGDLERAIGAATFESFSKTDKGLVQFKPTSSTVRAILRAGHRDAGHIYANAGLLLLFESLSVGRRAPEDIIKAKSWMPV